MIPKVVLGALEAMDVESDVLGTVTLYLAIGVWVYPCVWFRSCSWCPIYSYIIIVGPDQVATWETKLLTLKLTSDKSW